jgi:hypothetical protein
LYFQPERAKKGGNTMTIKEQLQQERKAEQLAERTERMAELHTPNPMTNTKAICDPTLPALEYRCYDNFPTVAAAENFLKDSSEMYGVVGVVVYTPNDPIMKSAPHGCGVYPFVLLQQGYAEGGSGNFIIELAELAEKHGGVYQYS